MSSDQEARGMLYADMENIRNILTFGDENYNVWEFLKRHWMCLIADWTMYKK